MGILNVTPDSFSDGGLYVDSVDAIEAGIKMMAEGADLIDVGGESTRPGAASVSIQDEIIRAIPVVEALARRGVPISIDTMKPEVAAAALDAGAFLVNDVSGMRNPQMVELVQARRPFVCIMHMQGEPRTMQSEPRYADLIDEVKSFLLEAAIRTGLPQDQIWLDPGFGFGKTVYHNLRLLKDLDAFVATGHPILIGVSRKSSIGTVSSNSDLPLPATDRLEGTLAAQTFAQMKGVQIIRAHDVKSAARAIRVAAAIQNAS